MKWTRIKRKRRTVVGPCEGAWTCGFKQPSMIFSVNPLRVNVTCHSLPFSQYVIGFTSAEESQEMLLGKPWSKESRLISRKADLSLQEATFRRASQSQMMPGVGRPRTHLVNTPDSLGSPDRAGRDRHSDF